MKSDEDGFNLWFPKKLMNYCAFNSIFHSSFGYSVDIDDKDCIDLRKYIDETFRAFGNVKVILWNVITHKFAFIPYLKSIFYPQKVVDIRKNRQDLIRKLIKKREFGEYDPQNPTSFIDQMLKALENGQITRSQMEVDVSAMFAAGTDTTSSTLEHAIVYTAKYGDIQEKVRQELLKNFKEKTDDDKIKFDIGKLTKLPLFRAIIKEILRISSVAPGGLPHRASDDLMVEYEGRKYQIPKGSTVIYQIAYPNTNRNGKELFMNDYKKDGEDGAKRFCLENWLDESGGFRPNKSELIFGHGYRDCVGKMLAMKELHMVMGYLLLNYKFELEDKDVEIKAGGRGAVVIDPPVGVRVSHYKQ